MLCRSCDRDLPEDEFSKFISRGIYMFNPRCNLCYYYPKSYTSASIAAMVGLTIRELKAVMPELIDLYHAYRLLKIQIYKTKYPNGRRYF